METSFGEKRLTLKRDNKSRLDIPKQYNLKLAFSSFILATVE